MPETDARADITRVLSEGDARGLLLVHLSLILGVVAFGAVVLVLNATSFGGQSSADTELLQILSLAHAALFAISFPMALVLYAKHLDGGVRRWATGGGDQELAASLRSATLVRAALLEGPALFGLVICLLGVIQGALETQPILWLNALSAGIFILYGLSQIPTRDRIETQLQDRLGRLRLEG